MKEPSSEEVVTYDINDVPETKTHFLGGLLDPGVWKTKTEKM